MVSAEVSLLVVLVVCPALYWAVGSEVYSGEQLASLRVPKWLLFAQSSTFTNYTHLHWKE